MNISTLSRTQIIKHFEAQIASKDTEVCILAMDNMFLEEKVRLLEFKIFGKKSEKNKKDEFRNLATLFDEPEAIAAAESPVPENNPDNAQDSKDPENPTKPKNPRGRKPLSASLPHVERIVELPVSERMCPTHGVEMVKIGEERSEKLESIPAKHWVDVLLRHKYACPCCKEGGVITTPRPPDPFPKSVASANSAAFVMVNKYADGLPLYRQAQIFERNGLDISRGCLAQWVIRSSEILRPISDAVRDALVGLNVVHMDETILQVLKEQERAPESKSYMWVMAAPYNAPIKGVYFEYHPSRSGKAASHVLSGFKGTLVCDGYDGYNAFARANSVTRAGCWAHARRKFTDAVKASPKGSPVAEEFIALIKRLYDVERLEGGAHLRKERSKPILEALRTKLHDTRLRVPGLSALGRALTYLANEWEYLEVFIHNPEVPIDNNRCENAIRPFVIGRKGWLFSDSQDGAYASSVVYTLVECAKLNQINPHTYLSTLLAELAKIGASLSEENLQPLLPWNFKNSFH